MAELAEAVPIRSWSFAPPVAEEAGWQTLGRTSWSERGLLLHSVPEGASGVWRQVDLDAGLVDEVVVDLGQRARGRLRLSWAAPGEPMQADRSLLASAPERSSPTQAIFPLRAHPRWGGAIGSLRLTANLGTGEGRAVELLGMSARGWRFDSERLRAVSQRAWRIELGHERRDALAARPGEPLAWEVGDPAGRRLVFGFGAQPLRAGRVLFRVWAEEAGERGLLWEAPVGEGGLPADRWHQADLSLPRGRPGPTLLFEAVYEPGFEEVDGLGFWAVPELVWPEASDDRPDLVLISIDTLRADRLSLYGHDRPTSPHLDAWARQAAVFERVVTSAPWTLPAHLSLFTGLDALGHGVNHRTRVPDGLPLLAERLREAGYQTLAVTGGGYLAPEFGLDRGFERYRWWPEHTADEELAEGVRTALAWLEEPPRRPFFLFFHTYETHYPYRAREPYFARFAAGVDPQPYDSLAYVTIPPDPADGFLLSKEWRLGGEPLDSRQTEVLGALYDSGVAYTDVQLAPLLERLATGEAGSRTVIAITSDHGESLGENGLAGHAYLDDANTLVPLVLRLPGGEHAGRIVEQARLVDLAPTLLELSGAGPTPDLDGRSLLPLLRGADVGRRPARVYAAFSNRGIALRVDNRLKYLWNDSAWPPLVGREALFDLVVDPMEQTALGRDPRLDGLREEVTTALAEVAGALRLRFANGGSKAFGGRLVGGVVQPARLKSPHLPAGALRWEGPRAAGLRVPAGSAFDLLIENPTGDRLELTLEPDFTATLALGELGAGWRAVLDGGRWRLAAAGEPPAAAQVRVGWNRTFGPPTADPASTDTALREQLKALGYVQ